MVGLGEFVAAMKEERDSMLSLYVSPEPTTHVGILLADAGLTEDQKHKVVAALDSALTDAFYSILLGLDGAGALGSLEQQSFTITGEDGHVVSAGRGDLEELAYDAFHGGS